jgi:hypothetical protein
VRARYAKNKKKKKIKKIKIKKKKRCERYVLNIRVRAYLGLHFDGLKSVFLTLKKSV